MRKYFIYPKKKFRWRTIHSALLIAFFIHICCLAGYAIFKPDTKKKDYEFFEVNVVEQEEPKSEMKQSKTEIKIPKSKALVKDVQDYEPAPAPSYKEVASLPDKPYPTVAPKSEQKAPELPGGGGSGPPVLGVQGDNGEYASNGGWGQGNAGSGDGSGIPGGQGWGGPITGGDGAGGSGPGGLGGGDGLGNTDLRDKVKDMRCLGCKAVTPGGNTLMNKEDQPQLLNFENAVMKMFQGNPDSEKSVRIELRMQTDESGKVIACELVSGSGIPSLDDACVGWGKVMKFAVAYENGKAVGCTINFPVIIEPKVKN